MALELFGYRIGKISEKKEDAPSFAPPVDNDGSIMTAPGGAYGISYDLEGQFKTEAELISKYRNMLNHPEVDLAVDDIVNEAIVVDERRESPVDIVMDNLEQPENIKEKIRAEFDEVLQLLDFQNQAYDIFKRWYVDGRLFYHKMIDTQKPRNGIVELRYVDPRQIKKVKEEKKKPGTTVSQRREAKFYKEYNEYFIYNESGIGNSVTSGVRIAPDAITYVHSGIMNNNNSIVLSHLHKALKAHNQLKWLEDSLVIYRLSRAPERRIFYIDIGNLPKAKAEQYLQSIMTKYKNKLVYNASTGEMKDDTRFMSMMEDFWLPRREGGKGTEVTTLPGGQNLGEIEDVEYFRRKLYKSLNVPVSRMEADGAFNLGRSSEITRDEVKFSKFVKRLRSRFSHLFDDILGTQLALKGIVTKDEWDDLKQFITYDFLEDNHFSEMKTAEVLRERLTLLTDLDQYTGVYYSKAWIRKNILQQNDEEIIEIDKEIKKEKEEEPDEGEDDETDNEPVAKKSEKDSGGGFPGFK